MAPQVVELSRLRRPESKGFSVFLEVALIVATVLCFALLGAGFMVVGKNSCEEAIESPAGGQAP